MTSCIAGGLGALTLAVGVSVGVDAQGPGRTSPTFTLDQAAAGEPLYARNCASCHGENLDDGEFAPPLVGNAFGVEWGGRSVFELLDFVETRMPPTAPGSLSDVEYRQVLAFMFERSRMAPGADELPDEQATLENMLLPAVIEGPSGGLSAAVSIPPNPEPRPNPLDQIRPVTDAMLANPDAGQWLTWRRAFDAKGYSPLDQIDTGNIGELQVAWTWSLPIGPSEATPLVHDGVMFVHGFGDVVQALDAETGDLLWQYQRRMAANVAPSVKRAISIYGDKLFVPTSDVQIVALDARTGEVIWEVPIADVNAGFRMTGGPLVAAGKVMIGTVGRTPGGNYITALDAETGEEAWRFYAIARPGDPGGDTWNGLDLEARNGASVWVPGSYDPELNLAYFGPAQTYDTGPLRVLADESFSNDGLYTNSTVALDPDTGRLVWFYQHLPNDQWDLDWAFERTITDLPVGGTMQKVVVTVGKQAIFDVLRADDGSYVFSMDLGLQNVVDSIDPTTGAKRIAAGITPGDGETKFVCPHAGGAKSWLPGALDPETSVLYIPLVESCMDLTPVAPGGRGSLSSGVNWTLRARPDSDGRYGRLQAINLETRETEWIARQRAPQSSGVLVTAGKILLAGALDRVLTAYDAGTGDELWSARLNDVPNTAPFTYMVGDRQYIGITVGNGGAQVATFPQLVPEIRNPPVPGAAVWVFALPDSQ
jgi:alcohol dehydrogenase (cytochrome c)